MLELLNNFIIYFSDIQSYCNLLVAFAVQLCSAVKTIQMSVAVLLSFARY